MTETDRHSGGKGEVLSSCVETVNIGPGVVRHVPVVEVGVEIKYRNPPGLRTRDGERHKYYEQSESHNLIFRRTVSPRLNTRNPGNL